VATPRLPGGSDNEGKGKAFATVTCTDFNEVVLPEEATYDMMVIAFEGANIEKKNSFTFTY